MDEKSYVIVFPNIFSKNKIPNLISNIKKILKIENQQFKSVKRDGDIILIDANDPVFASSTINLLFGIEKIAIARQVRNDFQNIVNEITNIGGSLLLKGEKFIVKVEGISKGFVTKDVEIATTSNIIEKKRNLGAHPGTEENFDKLLYTYITKNNAYICIFSDTGNGGIPYQSQSEKTICAIYDEISAVSCFETIKQGYDTKIIICYRQKSELMNLAKIINQIIPRMLYDKIELEFLQLKISPNGIRNYLIYVNSILEILLHYSNNRVSLALSPLIFSSEFIDNSLKQVFSKKKIPIIPLTGVDNSLFDDAKEIGLERNMRKIEKMIIITKEEIPLFSKKEVENALKTKKTITVKIGPNNVHDILDSLENH
ncbi:MAG: thiamine biosynthesis protein [Nitrosopumilus sp.]|uniref:THUMP domain-containing protein n=1 Tax=Nitrosopumilus sp. TaxID=2024843 RepID=UPI00246D725B|nr:THUMP domain-containing protein [Nitrosopumilus sp.]MDH5431463.1 thiamine biosynthesis protein [Nitrosopumilus sp.]MDH5665037.1 thiamine biosynthesis protein [Nitrosopumilus sp.]MDH5697372.1 thiamine biosynthesis protein [Nitrosopumilus sp.]